MILLTFVLVFIVTNSKDVTAAVRCKVFVEQGALLGESVELVTNDGTYCSFKGIPYAEPPINELRFKAPLEAQWWGMRTAVQHGPVCPQIDIVTNQLIPGNEDCLYLNVYSPDLKPENLLPVLLYIHGGGFKSSSGNVDEFGPDFFIRGYNNVVVVTINYRLDALGFLSLGTKEVPGNAGLKDQVLALKWVNKNIKQFGGDPSRVTLMGESAGAVSVALHQVSPMSSGLFHRIIALSGSPYNDWSLPFKPVTIAFQLGKNLGFETRDPEELLHFLQRVPSIDLVNYTAPNIMASEEINGGGLKSYYFPPVTEAYCGTENFICENLLLKEFRHINQADIMFGHTNEEAVLDLPAIINVLLARYDRYVENFAMRKVCESSPPDTCLKVGNKVREFYFGNKSVNLSTIREFINYANDAIYKYDIVRYFSEVPNYGKKFMYQFSSFTSRNQYGVMGIPFGIKGAAHIDDVRYLFDPKAVNFTLDVNSIEFQIINLFTTLVKNFVHFGDPTPPSINMNFKWPQFEPNTMEYLNIGTTDLTLESVHYQPYYKFWLQLLQSVGIIY